MYKDLGQQTEPTGIIDASTRMASASSVSALLQALTASTQDLQDIYLAQFVCLAQAHSADGVMIQLSPQQVSLVDTLRLLRQRRKIDPLAAAFVVEQLKGAHAVVTQVIFGLSCNERLIAEARCCLGDSHLTGHMYVTNSCLCFTTMLGSDLKTMTDTTVSTMLDKVITISAGSDPPDSLVLVTSTFEQFTFSAFSSTQERDRLLHLLDREPTNKLSLSTSAASSAVLKRTSRQLVADGVAGDISTPQVVHPATTNFGTPERPSAGCPPRMASVSGDSGGANGHAAGNGIDRQGSHERIASALVGKSLAQTLGTPESAAPSPSNSTMRYSAQLSMTPVMSVPCELVGTLRNKDGLLQVFSTHIEFVGSPSGQQLHFFKLETIELISQKSVFMEGSVLSVQISEEKAPFLFSGMTDALIASLKQSISEQCYRLE